MERLTIPDVRIDEKTQKRTFICADKVSSYVMEFYWRLKKIEDILGEDYDLDRLRELVEADRKERCKILPVNLGDTVYYIGCFHGKLICEAKVEEIYIWDDTISLGVTSGFGVFTLEENEYFLTKESAETALKGEAHE